MLKWIIKDLAALVSLTLLLAALAEWAVILHG